MIYELFGLPGSGKTTCGNIIQEEFNINNKLEFYRNHFWGKIIFHVFLKIFFIDRQLKNKFTEIINVIGNIKTYKNSIDCKISIELYIKYIIFVYFIEKKSKEDILIDEGIIHYLSALYAEFNVSFNKLDKIIEILEVKNEKTIVGLKCSKEQAFTQIKKRNRKRAAMDFLSDRKLNNLLDRYLKAEEYFCKKYPCLTISEIKDKIEKRIENEI